MSRFSAPVTPRLADVDAERVRREHDDKIRELQTAPSVGLTAIADRQLADGVVTLIGHPLRRAPAFVTHSPPRGASATGRIEEIRDGSFDRTKFVALKATGWGATITVDVQVL